LLSATTSSRAFVIATIDDIEAEGRRGEIQNDAALPAGGASAERFLAVKEEDRDSVRAAPADGFAPRFDLSCLRPALHATQIAHHREWEVAGASGAFHSVYEAPEQVGNAQSD
jgi:hypothetical protein